MSEREALKVMVGWVLIFYGVYYILSGVGII